MSGPFNVLQSSYLAYGLIIVAGNTTLERFPFKWNRERFHLNGKARSGDADYTGPIPFG